MIDQQAAAQAVQAVPAFVNWTINFPDLLAVGGAAAVLYGRLIKIETQIKPIVTWWNKMREMQTEMGQRWTDMADHVERPIERGPGSSGSRRGRS